MNLLSEIVRYYAIVSMQFTSGVYYLMSVFERHQVSEFGHGVQIWCFN